MELHALYIKFNIQLREKKLQIDKNEPFSNRYGWPNLIILATCRGVYATGSSQST